MKTIAVVGLVSMIAVSVIGSGAKEGRSCCAKSAENTAAPSSQVSGLSLYQLDSTWTNDSGSALKLEAMRGRPQVVTMFFAQCNYACPLLVYQMQQIESALPESLRGKVGFTLISFDTERDTPAALQVYRKGHGLDAQRWTLLRGSPEDVLDCAAVLNVKFKKDTQGQFQHSNVITLLNADGEIVYQQLGLTADCNEMNKRVTDLLK